MNEQDEHPPSSQPTRIAVTHHTYQSLVDQRIAQAYADGLMNDLAGQGQPLRLDDDSLVPEEYRAGFRLLKNNGFAPPWIEARRTIDTERDQIATWLARTNKRWATMNAAARTAAHVEYARKLQDLQRLIATFNLTAPSALVHLEGVRMQEELNKLGNTAA